MLIPYLVLLCEFFENFRFFTNVDLRSIFTDIRSQYVEMARTNTFGKNLNSQIFCHSKIYVTSSSSSCFQGSYSSCKQIIVLFHLK